MPVPDAARNRAPYTATPAPVIVLVPPGIEIKGRNGYFHLHRAEVRSTYALTGEVKTRLELYSKRQGDAPPAVIEGTAQEILQWLVLLQSAVEQREAQARPEPGTTGQDRKSYSDDQDRDSYTVGEV